MDYGDPLMLALSMMRSFLRRPRAVASRFGAHRYLALLLVLNGLVLLRPIAERVWQHRAGGWFADWLVFFGALGVSALPQAVVAAGLTIMAVGVALRARLAWVLSLLLLMAAAGISVWGGYRDAAVLIFSIVLACLLLFYWRRFDRISLAAGTLFAILSIGALLIYAVFGALYFGNQFSPPVHDLVTAFYFAIVSMSTVGYGDITPHTDTARLFTISVVVAGIAAFATSISAIAGPVIGGSLKRIVKGSMSNVNRKNHYLIVGASPVAHSVHACLKKRGYPVAVIVSPDVPNSYDEHTDVVIGDPSDATTLRKAGAENALAVLALRADDAENAFVVLAVKELAPKVRTVALVNESRNLQRIHLLQPDMVFSPQMLAGELLARSLNNETIDNDLVTRLLFGHA